MSISGATLSLALFVGGAVLALWLTARFPRRDPSWTAAIAHAAAGTVLANVLLPAAMQTLLREETRLALIGAAIGLALPALTYMFLGAIWIIRATQELLPPLRR